MASSYLLDQSKRITSPQIPELKYGEIAPECLKNIGFTFKEDFTEAAKELEDSYDEIFKPVIEILNSLLKATGIKFPSDPKKLREQLIVIDSMLTLLQAKVNAETSTTDETGSSTSTDGKKDETSQVIQELSSMLQNWSYAYTHVIPMRKSSPRVDMKIGGELKIDFAYGKCNLFNARKEVWEPLMKIKSKLFPTTTPFYYGEGENKTKVTGLSTIQGIDVPFLNAAFPATFFTLLSETNKAVTKFPFQKELSLQSEEGVLGRSLSGAVDSLKKSAKEAIGELREGVSEVFTGNSEEGTNGSGSTGTQAQPAESQINKKLKEQMNGITSVKDNLARIIMNKPAITAYINEQFYEKNFCEMKDGVPKPTKSFMFRLGYPQMFAYRVEDLCNANSNRISLNEVLPTSVDITFDFSNTDEAGTPMSGQLAIKGLWSLRTSGGSLNLWEA